MSRGRETFDAMIQRVTAARQTARSQTAGQDSPVDRLRREGGVALPDAELRRVGIDDSRRLLVPHKLGRERQIRRMAMSARPAMLRGRR